MQQKNKDTIQKGTEILYLVGIGLYATHSILCIMLFAFGEQKICQKGKFLCRVYFILQWL